ncbi:MAG: MFS transporter [Rhizobiaceae bacterium]
MPSPMVNRLVLLSASLLCLALGSVHAFSVFLEPLEQQFGVSRSTASFTYSLALVSLTLAVLIGHRVFAVVRASLFVGLVCLAAAAGCLLAANASTMLEVWLGYSLLFGAANGFGYAFGLQISAQAYPGREGLAMGSITACYALGAAAAPVLFSWAILLDGFRSAMLGLAAALMLIAPICALLLQRSGAQFRSADERMVTQTVPAKQVMWLWLGYGAGVVAGLMQSVMQRELQIRPGCSTVSGLLQ